MPKRNYVQIWMAMLSISTLTFLVLIVVDLPFDPVGNFLFHAVIAMSAITCLQQYLSWRKAEKILIDEIGWSPFKLPRKERWKWYRLEEAKVREVLQDYAATLDMAIQEEETLLASAGAEHSGPKRYALLLQLSGNVREAKKEFWRIHHVFELFGFKLRNSYKDYVVPVLDYRSGVAEG